MDWSCIFTSLQVLKAPLYQLSKFPNLMILLKPAEMNLHGLHKTSILCAVLHGVGE